MLTGVRAVSVVDHQLLLSCSMLTLLVAFSNKLATASPSGNFLIFDINKGKLGKSPLDSMASADTDHTEREVSGGHPRPMNTLKLCQAQTHGHLLITGGTEGHAKIWDLRDREPSVRKHFRHSGSVTALCFCPDDPHQFLVGLDSGTIQRYDLRHYRNGRVWGAHGNKAVMDLKWKEATGGEQETGGGWLASAGADRTVQVCILVFGNSMVC